jgi:hypothetical protein
MLKKTKNFFYKRFLEINFVTINGEAESSCKKFMYPMYNLYNSTGHGGVWEPMEV